MTTSMKRLPNFFDARKDINRCKNSYPHFPQVDKNVMEKSTSQIRLQALYYLLVRRGSAERFYQAEWSGKIARLPDHFYLFQNGRTYFCPSVNPTVPPTPFYIWLHHFAGEIATVLKLQMSDEVDSPTTELPSIRMRRK
jgi:hypothetical protein